MSLLLAAFALFSLPAGAAPLLRIVAIGDTGKALSTTCATDATTTSATTCAAQYLQLRAHLAALSPAPDLVLATGDLYYGAPATVASYRKGVSRFWGKWAGPAVLPMRGNHDRSDDVRAATQPKVADTLAAAFPLPAGSPWARVSCVDGTDDPAHLCYSGQRNGVCVVVGDSADVDDIRVPVFAADCDWKIAAQHHPPATSFEKKSELERVVGALAVRAPDVVLAGHAHHLEGLVAESASVRVGDSPARMLSVVSGSGSEARLPSAPVILADGTVANIGIDPEGGALTGLRPAYVYADHGYTILDVYPDHLLLRPIVLRDAGPKEEPCWRWDKAGQALTSASCSP
ncbi:MAG: metallophosphoesterase [Pseudomonadota bacterium]|nr:metallophosphoesterase [Pseudomonadota bacterium]